MRRSIKAAVRSVEEVALVGSPGCRPWFLTLTYAPGKGYQRCDLSYCLELMRKWAARRGFVLPYVWTAELQVRGAVHYHVVLWLPKRITLPKPDKQGWWRHGSTQRERARSAVGYLLKYATKGDSGAFPRGLRLFGYGGLTAPGRQIRAFLCLPGWLHRQLSGSGFVRVVRLPGGLYVVEDTGEAYRSPWEFVRFDRDAGAVVLRKRGQQ